MKFAAVILGLWAISFGAIAGPNINVGTVFDYMDGDKSTYLKRVYNGGDSTAFVRISILEILYKPDGSTAEVPLTTQGSDAMRDGLIASPARLIIPAKGTQGTRLLSKGSRDKERYFRLRFVPVVPEKEDEFAITQEDSDEYKKTLSAGVNVMAGYGTIFIVRPKNPRFDTKIEDTPQQYSLRNNGNTVVVVEEFKDCSVKNPQDCKPITTNHILAGRTLKVTKEAGRHYRFKLVEGRAVKTIEVKGQ
ncbi:molecular chaperone [Pseudomonas sp. NKUCC02_KPG]|uniref:molecular chaperone n=1 Tax=Pseudomonas sp. NKUCC02_KPG TaxID=2842124 RepID=UPI001C5B06FA|nr:molecular chaperone [Pseudomonas sp. NKUCC02_KPG]MBW3503604.1 molecular chaperone [Pseudomonas sp. NKUCC02_KPG]